VSRFDSDIAEVVGGHFYQFGRAGVTYIDPNIDPVELTAIVGPEESDESAGLDGRSRRRVRSVTISLDPNSPWGGVADPGEHAELEIDGVVWAIAAIEKRTANLATLRVVRVGAVEKSREAYRGRR
jgi:hypothetical protein